MMKVKRIFLISILVLFPTALYSSDLRIPPEIEKNGNNDNSWTSQFKYRQYSNPLTPGLVPSFSTPEAGLEHYHRSINQLGKVLVSDIEPRLMSSIAKHYPEYVDRIKNDLEIKFVDGSVLDVYTKKSGEKFDIRVSNQFLNLVIELSRSRLFNWLLINHEAKYSPEGDSQFQEPFDVVSSYQNYVTDRVLSNSKKYILPYYDLRPEKIDSIKRNMIQEQYLQISFSEGGLTPYKHAYFWVLAHEVGHVILRLKFGDESEIPRSEIELISDRIAYKLLSAEFENVHAYFAEMLVIFLLYEKQVAAMSSYCRIFYAMNVVSSLEMEKVFGSEAYKTMLSEMFGQERLSNKAFREINRIDNKVNEKIFSRVQERAKSLECEEYFKKTSEIMEENGL